MASKVKSKATAAKPASELNVLKITQEKGKSRERLLAEVGFSPCGASADTARTFSTAFAGQLGITEAIAVLQAKAEQVQRGDLSDVEATLTAQAVALDAIFNGLAQRAAQNIGQYMGATETYLRLALKAQAQCRATLETLAEVKYPKAPTFVRQQNVAYQQQVNNGTSDSGSSTRSHVEENNIQQNKLLEDQNHECTHLDTNAAAAAGAGNPTLETVGAVNRAKKPGKQGQGFQKCL